MSRRKKDAKKDRVEFRADDELMDALEYMTDKTGESKSTIIRKAIKMYKNLVEAQYN